MVRCMKHAWICGLIAGVWATASLAATWTVTTADFAEQSGELASLTGQSVDLKQEQQVRQYAWRDVAAVEQRGVRMVIDRTAFVLQTADGQRISGTPIALADDTLVWKNAALGAMRIPLQNVRGFCRASQSLPAAQGEDVVLLANRDELRGIVDRAEGGISVQQGERKTEVKWETIAAISLAQVAPPAADSRALSIRLADGSVFLAKQVQEEGVELWIQSTSRNDTRLPMAQVAAIANLAGRVTYLAQLSPNVQYTPQSPLTADPNQGIRIVESTPIGERIFRQVIALRPRCSVKYTSPCDGELHLAFACADSGPLTSIDVLVQINGANVADLKDFRSSQPTPPQTWPIAKGQTVEIRADFGKNFDVQDTLLLLQAALVAK